MFILSPDHKNFQEAQEFICDQLSEQLERLAGYQILGSCDSFTCHIEDGFIIIATDGYFERLPLSIAAAMLQLKDFNPGIDVWQFFNYVKNDADADNSYDLMNHYSVEYEQGNIEVLPLIELHKSNCENRQALSAKYRESFLPFTRI
jgi:hypothetical protein